MGMWASGGGEVGEGVIRSRDLSGLSSSVSSSEKISLSGASLGGGEDPCAIFCSLSNRSRLSLF
jgi:hypothetical protein